MPWRFAELCHDLVLIRKEDQSRIFFWQVTMAVQMVIGLIAHVVLTNVAIAVACLSNKRVCPAGNTAPNRHETV